MDALANVIPMISLALNGCTMARYLQNTHWRIKVHFVAACLDGFVGSICFVLFKILMMHLSHTTYIPEYLGNDLKL